MPKLGNLKLIGWVTLIVVIIALMWYIGMQNTRIDNLETRNGTLADNLHSSLEINRNKVTYKYRDSTGKVKVKVVYVPPEGKVTVKKPKTGHEVDEGLPSGSGIIRRSLFNLGRGFKGITTTTIKGSSGTVIEVKKAGTCFELGMAGLASTAGVGVGVQARLLYYNRWGTGPGIASHEYGYWFFDRRIDDKLPLFKNTAIGVHAGYGWKDKGKVVGANISLFF